MYYVNTPQK